MTDADGAWQHFPMTGGFSRVPEEPAPTRWRLPSPNEADSHGLVGIGADLEPGTLLAGYRGGLFPMPFRKRQVGWWSPDPRGVLPLDGLKVSRSLRKSCAQFEVRVDTAFETVMRACADPQRPHGWINDDFVAAFCRLHQMGWAHSVEAWQGGQLVGGLYGVRIRRFFAGESMFHHVTDASKVALVGLVEQLREQGVMLLDVQWNTDHLASLGAIAIPRLDYLRRLVTATT